MPIRWRLTFWYTGILLLILFILGSFVYILMDYSLLQETDRNLNQKADEVIRSTRVVGNLPFFLRQVVLPDVEVFAGPDVYLQVVSTNGEIAAKSRNLDEYNLPVPQEALQAVASGRRSFSTISIENANAKVRMVIKPIFLDNDIVGMLQVARPLRSMELAMTRLRIILIWGGLAALFISLLLGWIMSGQALKPIGYLAKEAKSIGEDRDFQRRVTVKGPLDEIGTLAVTFNNMLGRLDEAYQRLAESLRTQQRFVADASHELRTPLTSIQGNVDYLLQKNEDEGNCPQDREALSDISSETRRISRLVRDLLTLARADAGFSLELKPLELQLLLEETMRQAQFLTKGQLFEADLTLPEGTSIKADADYLKQLLLIFLDNAFKYTPEGKKIIFQAKICNEEVLLIIRDEGIGIPEKDLPNLFERFYRAQDSRTGEGTGLGLSIAKWIIEQHSGRVTVSSELGQGSEFIIYFPVLRLF